MKEKRTLNKLVRENQGYRTTSVTEKNPKLDPITREELKEMLIQDGWKELSPSENFFRVGSLEEEENLEKFENSFFGKQKLSLGLNELDYEVIQEILQDSDWKRFTNLYPNLSPVDLGSEFNLSIKYFTYEREGIRISFILNSGNRSEESNYHLIYLEGSGSPCNWNVLSGRIYYYQEFIDNLHELISKRDKEEELESLKKRMTDLQLELN